MISMKEIEIKSEGQKVKQLMARMNQLESDNMEKQQENKILQQKLDALMIEKAKSDEMQAQILKQMSLMKEAIKDSQQCEIINKELLEKLQLKNEKMSTLKASEKMLLDQAKTKDEYIKKLKQRIAELEDSNEEESKLQVEHTDLQIKFK